MFGFGWLEILLVALLVLLVVGTGRFPGVARQAGRTAGLVQQYRQPWSIIRKILRLD